MNESLISFETAKLAKEKGFNIDCLYHYNIGYNKPLENIVIGKDRIATHHLYANNYDFETQRWGGGRIDSIICPTQSLLQKWLREVHNIIIEINYSDCEFWQWIIFCKHLNIHHLGTNEIDDINLSYEECLEIALQEALKLI